jgi:hypothetical protein
VHKCIKFRLSIYVIICLDGGISQQRSWPSADGTPEPKGNYFTVISDYIPSLQGQTRYRDQFTPPQLNVKTSSHVQAGPSSSQSNEPIKPLNASVVFVKDDLEIADFIWVSVIFVKCYLDLSFRITYARKIKRTQLLELLAFKVQASQHFSPCWLAIKHWTNFGSTFFGHVLVTLFIPDFIKQMDFMCTSVIQLFTLIAR